MRYPGLLDWRTGEHRSSNEKEARVKVRTVRSQWRERSMTNRHWGEPSFTGDNFPRWSLNPNHGFTEGLCVNIRRIAGRKVGYSKIVDACPHKLKGMQ
jgi:hypothetical protein